MAQPPTSDAKRPRGIQSAAVAARILAAFSDSRAPLQLREIAASANSDASNVYRYLVSFAEAGMVRRLPDGRYDLGPLAMRIGLTALGRLDEFDVVGSKLERLVEDTGYDAHAAVWGTTGPTVARWRGQLNQMSIHVREGTVLPLVSSATGRVWAAYQEESLVRPLLEAEVEALKLGALDTRKAVAAFEEQIAAVRSDRICGSRDERRAGISALSAAVFDRTGRIRFSITIMGPSDGFDVSKEGEPAISLRAFAGAASRALGAPDEARLAQPHG